jgi:hypothetical protein
MENVGEDALQPKTAIFARSKRRPYTCRRSAETDFTNLSGTSAPAVDHEHRSIVILQAA